LSATLSAMATAMIFATEVQGNCNGCLSKFIGSHDSLGIFTDCIHTLLARWSGDPLFTDFDYRYV
jgi:hypothetical protein